MKLSLLEQLKKEKISYIHELKKIYDVSLGTDYNEAYRFLNMSLKLSPYAAHYSDLKNALNQIFTRDDVALMLKEDKYIDLIIPRGGNSLVKFIKEWISQKNTVKRKWIL